MDNQPETLSPEESLQVIRTMIEKAKTTVADNSFYFLLWGWLVFTAALLQYILVVFVKTPLNGMAWNLMFIGFIVSSIRRGKEEAKEGQDLYRRRAEEYLDLHGVLQIVIVLIYL